MKKLSEVIRDVSPWTNRERLRCVGCGKSAYATLAKAETAVATIHEKAGKEMVAYEGPCGWFHLSTVKEVTR